MHITISSMYQLTSRISHFLHCIFAGYCSTSVVTYNDIRYVTCIIYIVDKVSGNIIRLYINIKH